MSASSLAAAADLISQNASYALFGRKYQIDIMIGGKVITLPAPGEELSQFRVVFDIQQRAYQILWSADISLYNLSTATVNEIMSAVQFQDMNVTVQAGYENLATGYGVIWDGPVFQTLFERENVTDHKLTLHCILGLYDLKRNFINRQFLAGITQAELARQIASQSTTPIQIEGLSAKLKNTKSSRREPIFGSPAKYFDEIAADNNCQWWLSKKGLSMASIDHEDDISASTAIVFSPPALPAKNVAGPPPLSGNGIIVGTPQQTPYGIRFTALMDARVQVSRPYCVVKIDNSLIRKMKQYIDPSVSQLPMLDRDGQYIVLGVRYFGDTRGTPWYIEIDGVTTALRKAEMMNLIAANTNGY